MDSISDKKIVKGLVVDVGETHIKLLATGCRVPWKIDSGPTMTARRTVAKPIFVT